MINDKFYAELIHQLPESNRKVRQQLAHKIINDNVNIASLFSILEKDKKTALNFKWLLTEIGIIEPIKLKDVLPTLMLIHNKNKRLGLQQNLITYWQVVGLPTENEADALNISFEALNTSTTDITTKSRAIEVLNNLSNKYPEIKSELKLSMEDQLDNYTKNFKNRSQTILLKLID